VGIVSRHRDPATIVSRICRHEAGMTTDRRPDMEPLARAPADLFTEIRFVLTDMDETLTFEGRLSAETYEALERLRAAGVRVVPVTAAPAGWCDQMARMWPIDGVIGENGGLFFRRAPAGREIHREFWQGGAASVAASERLAEIGASVLAELDFASFADDQPFRLTSLAFNRPAEPEKCAGLAAALRRRDACVTTNDLWILAWVGGYDKLSMARRILASAYEIDIDIEKNSILYCGDSTNDAPMFAHFHHTVGVSTVRRYLSEIPIPPRWITDGPGGSGFVEVARAVLGTRI
jgi:hypothetical protein